MGERDQGTKVSMQRDREDKERRTRELATDLDGTEHELDAEIDQREDEDLAEARAIDLADTPADDYVREDEPEKGQDRPPDR